MLDILPVDQREGRGSCGAACLKTILAYHGVTTTEAKLTKLLGTTAANGTRGEALVSVAKKFGLQSFIKDNSELSDLKKYLDKKIPIIVAWFSGTDTHYSVVVGIDAENIYLQDPELGHLRAMHHVWFKRVWFDFWGPFMKKTSDLILRRMIVIIPPANFGDTRSTQSKKQ